MSCEADHLISDADDTNLPSSRIFNRDTLCSTGCPPAEIRAVPHPQFLFYNPAHHDDHWMDFHEDLCYYHQQFGDAAQQCHPLVSRQKMPLRGPTLNCSSAHQLLTHPCTANLSSTNCMPTVHSWVPPPWLHLPSEHPTLNIMCIVRFPPKRQCTLDSANLHAAKEFIQCCGWE